MAETVPGSWYLTVICKGCGEPFAFADAPPPEDVVGSVRVPSRSVLLTHSPPCGHTAEYLPSEMHIRQVARMN